MTACSGSAQIKLVRAPGKSTGISGQSHIPRDSEESRKNVQFTSKDEYQRNKQKILTARYGEQQMKMIRKRIAVEGWVFETLSNLQTEAGVDDLDLDLDDVLNFETDAERADYIRDQLSILNTYSASKLEKFTLDVLERLRTL